MTSPLIKNPASCIPPHALTFGDIGAPAKAVTADTPLPVVSTASQAPARSTPLEGSVSGALVAGPFTPDLGRPIILTLSGDWSGTVRLLRSTDDGATRLPLTIGGATWGVYTAGANEPAWEESDATARLYLDIALDSGILVYRMAQ